MAAAASLADTKPSGKIYRNLILQAHGHTLHHQQEDVHFIDPPSDKQDPKPDLAFVYKKSQTAQVQPVTNQAQPATNNADDSDAPTSYYKSPIGFNADVSNHIPNNPFVTIPDNVSLVTYIDVNSITEDYEDGILTAPICFVQENICQHNHANTPDRPFKNSNLTDKDISQKYPGLKYPSYFHNIYEKGSAFPNIFLMSDFEPTPHGLKGDRTTHLTMCPQDGYSGGILINIDNLPDRWNGTQWFKAPIDKTPGYDYPPPNHRNSKILLSEVLNWIELELDPNVHYYLHLISCMGGFVSDVDPDPMVADISYRLRGLNINHSKEEGTTYEKNNAHMSTNESNIPPPTNPQPTNQQPTNQQPTNQQPTNPQPTNPNSKSSGGYKKRHHSKKHHSKKHHSKKRHNKQRHTKKRHNKQRHNKQRHNKQRHTKKHHTKKHHTKKHHTKKHHNKKAPQQKKRHCVRVNI